MNQSILILQMDFIFSCGGNASGSIDGSVCGGDPVSLSLVEHLSFFRVHRRERTLQ
jgi:hypothetical protein